MKRGSGVGEEASVWTDVTLLQLYLADERNEDEDEREEEQLVREDIVLDKPEVSLLKLESF
ncbi:uncharacterized, partial [Tachysurus ichikawai]